jgi:hypothetical protein
MTAPKKIKHHYCHKKSKSVPKPHINVGRTRTKRNSSKLQLIKKVLYQDPKTGLDIFVFIAVDKNKQVCGIYHSYLQTTDGKQILEGRIDYLNRFLGRPIDLIDQLY